MRLKYIKTETITYFENDEKRKWVGCKEGYEFVGGYVEKRTRNLAGRGWETPKKDKRH